MLGYIRNNVARKIAFMVGASCLLVTLGGLVILMAMFRADIREHSQRSVELLCKSMESAFSVIDQDTRSHPVSDIIGELSSREEINFIRVFNRNGRVVWSKKADEPGQQLDQDVFNDWRNGLRFERERDHQPVLGILSQIRAKASCTTCHANKDKTPVVVGDLLGGIQMEASYSKFTEKLTAYGYLQSISALLLVAFVTMMTIMMVRRFLGLPLQKITQAIRDAASGNYLNRLEQQGSDELGHLANEVNRLLTRLTDIQASKIDTDMELDQVQLQLKLKQQLEEKNQIIEETNRHMQKSLNELTLLFDINRALTSTLEIDQVLKIITEMIGNTLGFNEFALLLLDDKLEKLEIRFAFGRQTPGSAVGRIIDLRTPTVYLEAVRKGRTIVLNDLKQFSRAPADDKLIPSAGSFLSIPMRHKDRILGLLNFTRPDADAFLPDEVKLLTSVAQQAAMAILNAQLYQEKLDLSITDELTKLPNRRQMQARLEIEWNRAHRFSTPMSLLMIDIDHFKRYNDVNGHLLGDQVLEGIARVLVSNTRKVDTVTRFGGEEFVVILPGQDKASASSVADKLCRAVARARLPRMETQPGGHLSISVGVSSLPEDAEETESLLHFADLALYVAKNEGRGRVAIYQKGMENVEQSRQQAKAKEVEQQNRRRRRRFPQAPALPFREP